MAAGLDVSRTACGVELRLLGGVELIDGAVAEIRRSLEERGRAELLFDMELLAREALLNALKNGAPRSASGEVRARLDYRPGAVSLRVEDDGPGFDWRSRLGMSAPEPGSESGRGVFIMKNYADTVEFSPSGNAVLLTKRVAREDQGMTATESSRTIPMPEKITAQETNALREEFKALIASGVRELTLDFTAVRSIDSMGIGLLVAAHNSLAKAQGRLMLTGVGPEIFNLLTLMRIDKHMSVAKA